MDGHGLCVSGPLSPLVASHSRILHLAARTVRYDGVYDYDLHGMAINAI
jgi:hypothetical protein